MFSFLFLKDNLCDNALDLTNGLLKVVSLPLGTYCKWLISAQEDDEYVTLEFLDYIVKIINSKQCYKSWRSYSGGLSNLSKFS